MSKQIKFKSKKEEPAPKISVDLSAFRSERMIFNFSFLTNKNKYNLSSLEKNVYKSIFHSIEKLSSEHINLVLGSSREQGIEFIKELKRSITSTEFINSDREKECDDKFCVVRVSNKGRLIGKMNKNLFYVLAIDTHFDLYDH